jgi:hypothetical protein
MKNELNQTDTVCSPRSQRSLIAEDNLRRDLGKIDDLIGLTQRQIAELEKAKARQMGMLAKVRGVDQVYLSHLLADLEDKRRKLAAYKEQRAFDENTITQLAPTPASITERAERQQYLAGLAIERLGKDTRVNDLISSLRKALRERAELTATMKESAATLDFTSKDDFLDAQRFDELLALLPEGLLARSERWAGWFLGKQKDAKSYIVRDRLLVIPESLATHGIYRFGDRVELREEEAQEFLRKDRPAPERNEPWHKAPPSIMTIEDWEAATVAAAERGITVQNVMFWEHVERDAKNKETFNRTGQHAASVDVPLNEDRGDLFTLKVKARDKIRVNGQEYGDGDVFEFRTHEVNAREMFQEGRIARP